MQLDVVKVIRHMRFWLAPDDQSRERVMVTLYRDEDGIDVAQIHMTNGAGMSPPRDPEMLPVPRWIWESGDLSVVVYWAAESATTGQIDVWADLGPTVDSGRTGALTGPYIPARTKCGVIIPDCGLLVMTRD